MAIKVLLTLACCASTGPAWAKSHAQALPPLVTQESAEMVTSEHSGAPIACDRDRLGTHSPEEVRFILPDGVWVEGGRAIGDVFAGVCKAGAEGDFQGATFLAGKVKKVENTLNVSWRVEADWLADLYKRADADVTHAGLIYVRVKTFDPADMKFR
jgi:hypothetical protein